MTIAEDRKKRQARLEQRSRKLFDIYNKLTGEPVGRLGREAFQSFGDLSDFIWKTPRFLESEMKLEAKKLNDYFPITGSAEVKKCNRKMRKHRFALEFTKVMLTFPRHMAVGNFFAAVSLYEAYCLALAYEIEKLTGKPLEGLRGQGITKLFKYFSVAKIQWQAALDAEQVNAILKIRNCLSHANGILKWSRDSISVSQAVTSRSFLPKEVRKGLSQSDEAFQRVKIVEGAMGKQVLITNGYAHIATEYLRNHFVDLCHRTEERLALSKT